MRQCLYKKPIVKEDCKVLVSTAFFSKMILEEAGPPEQGTIQGQLYNTQQGE